MGKDIERHVQICERSTRRKTTPGRTPVVNIQTSQPQELVCMDVLTLEQSKGGRQHILVVTDHFTRYAQAYQTRTMTAKTTAAVFFHNCVVHYGLPVHIHSDHDDNFEGALMKEMCLAVCSIMPWVRTCENFSTCLKHLTQRAKMIGRATFDLWYMHTTAQGMRRHNIHHSIPCLEELQDYQLTWHFV